MDPLVRKFLREKARARVHEYLADAHGFGEAISEHMDETAGENTLQSIKAGLASDLSNNPEKDPKLS